MTTPTRRPAGRRLRPYPGRPPNQESPGALASARALRARLIAAGRTVAELHRAAGLPDTPGGYQHSCAILRGERISAPRVAALETAAESLGI